MFLHFPRGKQGLHSQILIQSIQGKLVQQKQKERKIKEDPEFANTGNETFTPFNLLQMCFTHNIHHGVIVKEMNIYGYGDDSDDFRCLDLRQFPT